MNDTEIETDVDVDIEVDDTLPEVAAAPIAPERLVAAIEAILFVAESPITVMALAAAVQQPTNAVSAALTTLRTAYDERGAGIELRDIAGGVRLFTRDEHADVVAHFLQ